MHNFEEYLESKFERNQHVQEEVDGTWPGLIPSEPEISRSQRESPTP